MGADNVREDNPRLVSTRPGFAGRTGQKAPKPISLTEREATLFWSRVDRGDPEGCWPWAGSRLASGYGQFWYSGHRTNRRAHRIAWTLTNGPIPRGLDCLHRCDNPPCVNPAHLFLGTNADNMADKIAKGRGRGPEGESNPKTRLTASDVAAMRRLYKLGVDTPTLGKGFGCSQPTAHGIVTGRVWRSAPGPITPNRPRLLYVLRNVAS